MLKRIREVLGGLEIGLAVGRAFSLSDMGFGG
jgi:hypothetical protein